MSEKEVLVSIIIPAYNAESTIIRAIESVADVPSLNYEIIVVDDGSTDGTTDVINTYSQNHASTIRLIQQKNLGVAAARNRALQEAKGTYLMFVDADDKVNKDCLSSNIHAIESNNADMIILGYYLLTSNNTCMMQYHGTIETPGEAQLLCITDSSVNGYLWNKIFRLDLVKNNNLEFDESLHMGEDLLFVEQYLNCCNKVAVLQDTLYYYYYSNGNSHKYSRKNLTLLNAYEKSYLVLSNNELAQRELIKKYFSIVFSYYDYPEYRESVEKELQHLLETCDVNYRTILFNLSKSHRIRFRLFLANKSTYLLYSKACQIVRKIIK